jgi:ribonuclease Z
VQMIPRDPPRGAAMGFLYLPPFRVQGIAVAGEESAVQVPELDVCFDIGRCPRAALACEFVALSHGHMDHSAGLAYYFSQRHFQGMGTGTVVCHPDLEQPIKDLMRAWVGLESQRTPHNIIALAPDEETQIKPNVVLRAFATRHTARSIGFVVVERRHKLKPELTGLPQEELIALKKSGQTITHTLEVPLVCYTGDTSWGRHFDRPDVLGAKILITECTFLEPGHRDRAHVGNHLHLDDLVRLMDRSHAEDVVLVHLSRRTHLVEARKKIAARLPAEHLDRLHLLMDHHTNRKRYQRQIADADESDPNEAQVES